VEEEPKYKSHGNIYVYIYACSIIDETIQVFRMQVAAAGALPAPGLKICRSRIPGVCIKIIIRLLICQSPLIDGRLITPMRFNPASSRQAIFQTLSSYNN
jgi:hypothetical protein